MTLEELTVVINAQTSGLKKELNNVQSQLKSTEKVTNNVTSSMSTTLSKLGKYISVTAIVTGLTKIGKSALSAASDLAEVQNVVDVAFGNSAQQINEFAKNAITQFGITEYQAKKCASTFMAMSNGMGISAEAGKKMSVQLTGLSADMASFYNVSQDVAETALKSVFTGETESLKKFGVVMSETNLKAYALSQGITKEYSAMSQAEKVALRYNFVLQSTKNAQNDYSRTSQSWANQLRLLSNQWQSLMSVLGQVLQKVLLPILQTFTSILSVIVKTAQSMFGVADESETAGDNTLEISNNLEEADTNAKNLKKTLSGFDEINTLSSSGSSEVSGTGSISIDLGEYFDYTSEVEQKTDELTQKIMDKWQGLVDWFNELPKISFNIDKEQAFVDIDGILENLNEIFGETGELILRISFDIINGLDIGQLTNDVLSLTNSFTDLVSEIQSVLMPVIDEFYEKHISPLVEWIGDKLSLAVQNSKDNLDDWAQWFEDNGPAIQEFFTTIGDIAGLVFGDIKEQIDIFIGLVTVIVNYLSGLLQDILSTVLNVVNNVKKALDGILLFLEGVFSADITKIVEGIKQFFVAEWEAIKSLFKGIINSLIDMVNGIIGGINLIKLPNWDILGESAGKGINIPLIPKLANGGVITGPTIAMLGEYAGASSNPEIATPENKLREIFSEGNNDLIDVWISTTRQIITAINNKDMNVSIDDDAIGRSVVRANNQNKLRTGMALI